MPCGVIGQSWTELGRHDMSVDEMATGAMARTGTRVRMDRAGVHG